jgi:hypothetical protein
VNSNKSSKSRKKKTVGRDVKKEHSPLSLAPLTVEEAVTALFAVRPPAKRSSVKKLRGTN